VFSLSVNFALVFLSLRITFSLGNYVNYTLFLTGWIGRAPAITCSKEKKKSIAYLIESIDSHNQWQSHSSFKSLMFATYYCKSKFQSITNWNSRYQKLACTARTWQNTKELNMRVLVVLSAYGPSILRSLFPANMRVPSTRSWYKPCPRIFLHMTRVMKLCPRLTGGLFIISSLGGSVAKAKAPSVSMIMFTHSNWTAVSGAIPTS